MLLIVLAIFFYTDGHFKDFVILWNSISSLGGLGVSEGVDWIWGKLLFGWCFLVSNVLFCFLFFVFVFCFLFLFLFFLCYGWELCGFWDYIALPWCIGFYSLGCLGVSYGIDWFYGKPKFWCGFMLCIVFFFFFFS